MNVAALPAGLRRFAVSDLVAEPWRNGGGQTRQIAAFGTGDGGWDWRVSLADIRRDGPFSVFAGMDRQALLADGRQLTLRADAAALRFTRLGDGHAFDGELALATELGEGPVRLFNVMTRRGQATAAVSAHRSSAELSLAESGALVVLVALGEFSLSFRGTRAASAIEQHVGLGEGLHFHGLAGALRVEALSLDACLLVAQLSP